jgi:hypothetical protein
MLPVVLWNLQNGWVNVAHNAAHLSAKSEALVSLKFFLELLVGQLGLVGPLFLVACVYGLWRSFVFWRRGDEVAGLYVWSSLPLAVLCIGTSFVRRVYANWPMPIYIGGTLCLARLVYLYAVAPGRAESWARWSIGINTCVSALAFCIVLGFSMPLPGNILPTKKLVGWAELGQEIDKQRASFQAADSNDLPVIAADYGTASAIAFYSLSRPKVMCAVSGHRRMNQYDVWGGWEELEGMDALVVLKNDEHRQELSKMFSSFSPLGTHPNLEVFHHRTRIRGFQFYLGRDYIGGVPSTPNRR